MNCVAVNYITSSALNKEVFSVDDHEGFLLLALIRRINSNSSAANARHHLSGCVQRYGDISADVAM
jgi:hypothetical protein